MIPGLGRYPGERKSYPFQYSGLKNSMGCKESDMIEPLSLFIAAQPQHKVQSPVPKQGNGEITRAKVQIPSESETSLRNNRLLKF